MGVDWLLPIYDPFTRLLGVGRTRVTLLAQAQLESGHRILDIGCGTGSLAVLAKQRFPDADVVGIDPDERALERATRKARRGGVQVRFDRGFADALDYPSASFDRVFSSIAAPCASEDHAGAGPGPRRLTGGRHPRPAAAR